MDIMRRAELDMYSQYKGRFCVVIRGPYKTHRGLIKATHPDGRLAVELDTRREQLTHFSFDEVLIQE